MSLTATPGRISVRSSRLITSATLKKQNTIPDFIDIFLKNDSYPPVIIKNRPKIVQTLRRLDSMIEMTSVKEAFISQIKLMLLLSCKGIPPSFKKMHAVFLGPPGVGKSTVARFVADIWSNMGILNNHKQCNIDGKLSIDGHLQVIRGMTPCAKLAQVCDSLYDAIQLLNTLEAPTEEKAEIYSLCRAANEASYEVRANLCPAGDRDADEELSFLEYRQSLDSSENYIVIGREDLVGSHLGHTLEKTKKLLDDNIGKVIIIEEAYLLYTCQQDSYGMEALTMINRYMDEHSNDYIFIFIGYKEQLERSIFVAQPGLRRRIQWSFEIEEYSAMGLAMIFKQQVENSGWTLDIDKLEDFFYRYKEKFPSYGGDTERLLLQCQLAYATTYYQSSDLRMIIDRHVLDAGYKLYLESGPRVSQMPELMVM